MEGDEVKVLEKVNEEWWWVELGGMVGYVPSSHLSCDFSTDPWQDDEYFTSYQAPVMTNILIKTVRVFLNRKRFVKIETSPGNAARWSSNSGLPQGY